MIGIGPARQTNWDWRAAGNFICGGTGAGLYLVMALAAPMGVPVLSLGLLALAFVAFGLFLVWLELGRAWRSFNVMFNPRTSWMTRESVVAAPLFLLGLAGTWFGWVALLLAAAVFGVGFLYCQARVINESKGIPAWREPLVVPLLMVTGLAEGAGMFLVAERLLSPGEPSAAAPYVAAALLVLVAVRVWAWQSYRGRLSESAPAKALAALNRANLPTTLIGNVLPVILLAAALVLPGSTVILFPLAGLITVLGGWYLKFTIIVGASYNQGFALPRTPQRGSGGGPGFKPGWN